MENMTLKEQFNSDIRKKVQDKLGIKNSMAAPSLEKIVINSSTGAYVLDKKNLERAAEDLTMIAGQKPMITKARMSVSAFKLREGMNIGLKVTLRGARMYDFFQKLVKIVLPRTRDFVGVDPKTFDGKGNITLGFSEHIVFPEIDPGKVERNLSLQVVIVTSADNDRDAKVLLEEMGMPFMKEDKK